MTDPHAATVADAWVAYRVTHTIQTDRLVEFVREPTDEHEARFRDAAAAFRTAVYARDTALLDYMERIVSRAQGDTLAVAESLGALTRRFDHLEQHLDQETDLAQQRFDAMMARLQDLREALPA